MRSENPQSRELSVAARAQHVIAARRVATVAESRTRALAPWRWLAGWWVHTIHHHTHTVVEQDVGRPKHTHAAPSTWKEGEEVGCQALWLL
jgi:hypothetical protein